MSHKSFLLQYASDVTAEVVGKPSSIFFEAVLQDAGVNPSKSVMVGDDIVSDIGGAQACGMTGVLVRTGKFRPKDENHKDVKPDAIFDNLAQFVDALLPTIH
ncbi:phospholysine phosphohistidine inorganic pyrophosphate phosphatase-like [Plakobranchus ocellatus]|uniref:Phospholysine phosphohistidine inorganic pyrophosphate phosphatase-like n=1 Tax=Plakobranchus ocellatus TaxID=259542 RepID=A0AAV4BYK3_9GAST|nr:phospholysine phosphohistidine inorganic pyrophosphate phosphatase-like [Plakobranchus ocellatus]